MRYLTILIPTLIRQCPTVLRSCHKNSEDHLGIILGHAADVIAKLSGKNLPLSALRVKKFASSTEFRSAKANFDHFVAPFSLIDGLHRTLQSEFITPDPNREIFYTE